METDIDLETQLPDHLALSTLLSECLRTKINNSSDSIEKKKDTIKIVNELIPYSNEGYMKNNAEQIISELWTNIKMDELHK